jgi:hypothetical protein
MTCAPSGTRGAPPGGPACTGAGQTAPPSGQTAGAGPRSPGGRKTRWAASLPPGNRRGSRCRRPTEPVRTTPDRDWHCRQGYVPLTWRDVLCTTRVVPWHATQGKGRCGAPAPGLSREISAGGPADTAGSGVFRRKSQHVPGARAHIRTVSCRKLQSLCPPHYTHSPSVGTWEGLLALLIGLSALPGFAALEGVLLVGGCIRRLHTLTDPFMAGEEDRASRAALRQSPQAAGT